ncbi:MAG: acyl-ACP--UDP-N-acetylglucosamine O-acyltransferase [Deltaproteobacteria bacterium]|nr:acyl-ACP--UDP-N-acetylglucosamine O-acyltransferase [Deltaproteobacteria bacterium]
MPSIHPTAVVDSKAEIGEVEIGPYAVVGPGVRLADGVVLEPHTVVMGLTHIGPRTRVCTHASLGGPPQDRKHDDRMTALEIGADNVFREFTTAHCGSSSGGGVTVIGDRNYFMANSHVAHDCRVGSDCVLSNSAAVAGHVVIGDGVVLAGLVGVHQHVRIGRLAMVGGGAMCAQDIPPFTLAQGDRARLFGLNVTGLRRAGIDRAVASALKGAWRTLFVSGLPIRTAIARVREEQEDVPEVAELVAFLEASTRGVCRAARSR